MPFSTAGSEKFLGMEPPEDVGKLELGAHGQAPS